MTLKREMKRVETQTTPLSAPGEPLLPPSWARTRDRRVRTRENLLQ